MIRKSILFVLTLATGCAWVGCFFAPPFVWESPNADWRGGCSYHALFWEYNRVLESRRPESTTEWSWNTKGFAQWLIGNPELYYGTAVINWHEGLSRYQSMGHASLSLLVLIFGAYPGIVFIRGPVRRWRRRRKGLCLKCGYDLTGNTSGLCPECGTPIQGRTGNRHRHG